MIVVSDTTPLRHLIAIGKVDLLRKVYGAVVVPLTVWSELQAESTPSSVKTWLQSAPDWMQVRGAREPLPGDASLDMLDQLDAGEREAIRLALELKADLLLKEGGMIDGNLRRVVMFPEDGHPDLAAAVLNLTGDARDEIALWDEKRVWIYTQDRAFAGARIYAPVRNPDYNESNYRTSVSLPAWVENR